MTFDEAVRYLLSLGHETLALKLGLNTTEVLLRALGDPQTAYAAVQIAGTNGKGSTAVTLDSICRAAEIRTGLFTSPHLTSITERIRIDGADISREAFAQFATTVRERIEDLIEAGELAAPPTFFEQVTAIALLAFKESKIKLAILETGLGGRLDSTTVARADTVGITPISIDHQEYLGETLAEIAAEKAAIIRPGVNAVIAPQDPVALDVVMKACRSSEVIPRLVRDDAMRANSTSDGRLQLTFQSSQDTYEKVWMGLRGRHQVINVSLAIELAESLRERGFAIPHQAFVEGIERVRHPGRLELLERHPPILLDGAHNPAGARALRAYLDEFVTQPITLIFGGMRDKQLTEMMRILFPRARRIVLTEPRNIRAASASMLQQYAAELNSAWTVIVEPSSKKAIDLAIESSGATDLVCITGSLYLVGEVRDRLK